jgi:cysteine-rich repeat protein
MQTRSSWLRNVVSLLLLVQACARIHERPLSSSAKRPATSGTADSARAPSTDASIASGPSVDGGGSEPEARSPPETCAEPEDARRWKKGKSLFVDHDAGCHHHAPCFSTIADAVAAAHKGDTVNVLPGTYQGALVSGERGDVRITGTSGPEHTVITGDCFQILEGAEAPATVLIDHLTLRDCGTETPFVYEGWGVIVDTRRYVSVRIQDNVFIHNDGGAIGLHSSTIDSRCHVVIARNRIQDTHGRAGIDISLAADAGEDYCVRVENNLIALNDVATNLQYITFHNGPGRFEFVNNTIADNERAIDAPAGHFVFASNIVFRNTVTFRDGIDAHDALDVHHNLIDSGQFDGRSGNFPADPLFVDEGAQDYHLQADSPAVARGDPSSAPLDDLSGRTRGALPDIGAYQLDERSGSLPARGCGNSQVDLGTMDDAAGRFAAFEACDDGNTQDGDGCSSLCQLEPAPPHGQISLRGTNLCAIRQDGSLSCWYPFSAAVPSGEFRQVALSEAMGCALAVSGMVACWSGDSTLPARSETFSQIAADSDQVCGLRVDGGVTCWDRDGTRFEQDGNFVRVDTSQGVCALSADGEPTCWPAYSAFPSGPYLQMLPAQPGLCALRQDGQFVCMGTLSDPESLSTGLVNVSIARHTIVGLRPNGRVLQYGAWASEPGSAPNFIEVAAAEGFGCGLTSDHRVYCWNDLSKMLPQE